MFKIYFNDIYLKNKKKTIILLIIQLIISFFYLFLIYKEKKLKKEELISNIIEINNIKNIFNYSFVTNLFNCLSTIFPLTYFLFHILEKIKNDEKNGLDLFLIYHFNFIDRKKLFWKKLKTIIYLVIPILIFNSIYITLHYLLSQFNQNSYLIFNTLLVNFLIIPFLFMFPLLFFLIILNKLSKTFYLILKTILKFSFFLTIIVVLTQNILPKIIIDIFNFIYNNQIYIFLSLITLILLFISITVNIFYKKSIKTDLE